MALYTRPITQRDLDRIRAYHRGEIQKPKWLVDWEKKLEDAEINLATAIQQEILSPHQQANYVHAVVQMMRRRDMLYDIWMEGLPFKTWEELAAERPPSSEDLFRYTVEDTEDHLNGPGISAFVFFLNEKWKGFLKEFAHECLRDCDPLIEESIPMTPEVRQVLSYPAQAFGTKNKDVLESRLRKWAEQKTPPNAPRYVRRLLDANIMVALDNELGALTNMEFARCEAIEPDLEQMMIAKDPKLEIYLTQAQRWQIEVLLKMWPSA